MLAGWGIASVVLVLLVWSQLAVRRLRRMVDHDPLTGILGLRGWRKALLSAGRRPKARCVLLELDIDHFKRVNDKHGHDVGDLVLCGVAGVLREVCGRWSARTGGDELAALVPVPADTADAAAWARGLGAVLRSRLHHQAGSWADGVVVTVSVGVTLTDACDLAAARRRAEEVMYRQKRRRHHPDGRREPQWGSDLPAAA